VSFVDYLMRLLLPRSAPTYQRKDDIKKMGSFDIMKEELLRQCIRQKMGTS
jgi:hypothetical protein